MDLRDACVGCVHVLNTLASKDLPDLKLNGKKFCYFIWSCDTWQIPVEYDAKTGEKKQCKRFEKAIHLSCGYTPPSKFSHFVMWPANTLGFPAWCFTSSKKLCQDGIQRSCMALVFGTFLNFLKKQQDRHHLVMFTWSTFVENDETY